MKVPEYSKHDTRIAMFIMPPYVLVINYLLFGKRYFTELPVFLMSTLIFLAVAFVMYKLISLFAIAIRGRLPHRRDALKRGFYLVATAFIVTGSVVTILFWGYDYIHFMDYELITANYRWALLISLILNIIGTVMNEGASTIVQWQDTLSESEQLKKVTLQSRLDGLKDQVNPHFLFNSLNSLSSLISEDPKMASKFLDEMSKVYRYLLRNNEEGLTTLTAELQFVRSYFHLLKTRYGDGIDIRINVDAACMNAQIPPLTLQLLIENAVKHNVILKEQPLQIEIVAINDGRLLVKNCLQPKVVKLPSTKIGLNNIKSKYKLLNQPEIEIRETGKEFIVTVPLINN